MCPNKAMTRSSVVPVAALTEYGRTVYSAPPTEGVPRREPRSRLIAHPAQQYVLSRALRLLFRYAPGSWPGWVRTMDIALDQLDVATIEHPVRVFILPAAICALRTLPPAARWLPRASTARAPRQMPTAPSSSMVSTRARTWPSMHAVTPCASHLHFQLTPCAHALMKLNPAENARRAFRCPLADISVCFGFMHHVPSCQYRVREPLHALVRQTRPGGIIAISFWEVHESTSAWRARPFEPKPAPSSPHR